jgi:hypothetical protein
VQWNQQRVVSPLPQDQGLGLAQASRLRISSNLSRVLVDQVFKMGLWTSSSNSLSNLILNVRNSSM